VHPNPVVDFTATDTAGCAPLCLGFTDLSSIGPAPATNAQWSWDLGDNNGTTNSLSFDYCFGNFSSLEPAKYTVSLTVTSDSGCVTTKTKPDYITVYPIPLALFIADPIETNIVSPDITIQDHSIGATTWSWNFGDGDTASGPVIAPHTYADTGSYTITLLTNNQYNCTATAEQNIVIKPSSTFYVPSAFSPNGDGINDTFGGTGTFIREYSMSIYDRWGNFIFYTDDITRQWDGKMGSVIAAQDTYVYSIEITDFKKDKYWYKGIVTLVAGKRD
jgi:gliding motility-associated-like protein